MMTIVTYDQVKEMIVALMMDIGGYDDDNSEDDDYVGDDCDDNDGPHDGSGRSLCILRSSVSVKV